MVASEIYIDGVRYVPATSAGTVDVSSLANTIWSGLGRKIRFSFSCGEQMCVYADSALSVPLANPVAADASGVYPQMWTDSPSLHLGLIDEAGGLMLEREFLHPYRAS